MKQVTISVSRVEKYFKFVNNCYAEMYRVGKMTPKDLYRLQKKFNVSSNTISVMKDGGLIKKVGKFYEWRTTVPTTATAREIVIRLKEINKKSNNKYELLRAKKETPVQQSPSVKYIPLISPAEAEIHEQIVDTTPAEEVDRDLLERQFLDSMPKPKRKYNRRAKKEVSILWGLITYKTY